MNDDLEPLLVEVRASTQGFAQDIADMRGTIDTTLLDGFDRAGNTLERGLTGAIRRGSLGFDDLKRVALNTINEISVQAARNLFASIPGGGIGGLLNLGGLVGSVLGLPGRATGGPVSPGRGYLVGERGPELFVPTSSGKVENFESRGGSGSGRDVRVSIDIVAPRGSSVPQSLQRSSRQVASAVRRAIAYA
ncbi:MAG: tail tape measure protein [Sphingomonadaceae bacterium]|nr:tail tape measure protein [Sphingomonadaceae bacterium]